MCEIKRALLTQDRTGHFRKSTGSLGHRAVAKAPNCHQRRFEYQVLDLEPIMVSINQTDILSQAARTLSKKTAVSVRTWRASTSSFVLSLSV